MELNDFMKLIKKRQKAVMSFAVFFLIVSLIFTFAQPLKYGSKSRLLVVQSASGADPYIVSKSNEYLGNLFSQVVYSHSFFNLVSSSQFNVDRSYFGNSSNKQIKNWKKTVSAKSLGDTGIISINVYHPDPYQARQITLAINDVLINKNFNYQGLGNLVRVTVIDQPIVSKYPVKPDIALNVIFSVFSGLVVGLFYIYLFPESDTNPLKIARRKRVKKKKKMKNTEKEYIPVHTQEEVSEKAPQNQSLNTINIDREELERQGSISNILRQ